MFITLKLCTLYTISMYYYGAIWHGDLPPPAPSEALPLPPVKSKNCKNLLFFGKFLDFCPSETYLPPLCPRKQTNKQTNEKKKLFLVSQMIQVTLRPDPVYKNIRSPQEQPEISKIWQFTGIKKVLDNHIFFC